MKFTSTRNSNLSETFANATRFCMPADGGVYVPSSDSIEDLRRWIYYIDKDTSFTSIAGTLTSAFLKEEFSPIICEAIATSAFPFEPVVKQLDDKLFYMELFHGYTGCHKDFGVSFLCSYLETIHTIYGGNTIILDYSKHALGTLLSKVLHNKKHIKAVVVHSKGTVHGIADEDLAWNGGNVYPVEMEGSENDIKSAIGQVYADTEFRNIHNLTTATTSNIGRLIPQIFSFPYSFAKIKHLVDGDLYYACDAGNYSTLMAGLYSWRLALPLSGFYLPATDSLSRDVKGNPVMLDAFVDISKRDGASPLNPANLERLESFFDKNELMMRHFVYPQVISEKAREKSAKELFMKYGVFADAGTAAAYAAIKDDADEIYEDEGAVVLIGQKDPSLSADYCRHVLGEAPEMPEHLKEFLRPVQLGKPVISTVEELKGIISSLK